MTNEKKKTIIFTVMLAILALVLIIVFSVMELRKSGLIGSSESGQIIKEFRKVFNDKDRSVIYFASSTCGYCEMQSPILELVAEDYSFDYFDIDANELSVGQRNEVLETLGIEQSTPTTVIVEDGEVVATQVGFADGQDLVAFLKDSKIIPKDAVYSAEDEITFIDYTEYKKLVRSEDTHIITIGQSSCINCINIKSAFNEVIKEYNITINYLNLVKISEEETDALMTNLVKIGYDDPTFLEDGSFGTPLTLIVKNGKIDTYITGARTISQLVREFKKAGLIEE